MLHVFNAIPTAERATGRAAYRAFLAKRDGELDLWRRTLSRREQDAKPAVPVAHGASFDEGLYRALAEGPLDRAGAIPGGVLLVLALARVHAVFGFGSQTEVSRALQQAVSAQDDTEGFVVLERAYGRRALAATPLLFGVEPHEGETRETPRWPVTAMTTGARLGGSALRAGVRLAQEIVHLVALMNLLRVTREVFRGVADARDAIERRLLDVLIDAVGHISFRRLETSPAGMAVAARVLPAVATTFTVLSPATAALGAGVYPSATSIAFRLSKWLPAQVRDHAFVA
jgi:hypothetical protein